MPTFQPGANIYTQGFGSRAENVEVPVIQTRAPATTDISVVGKRWINTSGNATYTLSSLSSSGGVMSATWVAEGGGSSQLSTLTGDTGTATPSGGNIQIAGGAGITTSASGAVVTIALSGGSTSMDSFTPDTGTSPVVPTSLGAVTMAGTANQITTTGGTNTLTFSVPSAFIAPGSIVSTTTMASTTTLTAGTTFTATGGASSFGGGTFTVASGTNAINISADAAATTVNIGTGAAVKTVTVGSTNTTSATSIQAGSGGIALTGAVTSANAITVTSGAITATDGNLVFGTAGNKILSTSVGSGASAGANSFGTATLTGGTVTVSTTAVTASSIIILTRQSVGATGANDLGILSVGTIVAATSFVINAWTVTDATTLQADDVSVIGWMIIN
jgi:hypothetical protein